jgi:hypothetical protein
MRVFFVISGVCCVFSFSLICQLKSHQGCYQLHDNASYQLTYRYGSPSYRRRRHVQRMLQEARKLATKILLVQ